jgi:hypothetical protein
MGHANDREFPVFQGLDRKLAEMRFDLHLPPTQLSALVLGGRPVIEDPAWLSTVLQDAFSVPRTLLTGDEVRVAHVNFSGHRENHLSLAN